MTRHPFGLQLPMAILALRIVLRPVPQDRESNSPRGPWTSMTGSNCRRADRCY